MTGGSSNWAASPPRPTAPRYLTLGSGSCQRTSGRTAAWGVVAEGPSTGGGILVSVFMSGLSFLGGEGDDALGPQVVPTGGVRRMALVLHGADPGAGRAQ